MRKTKSTACDVPGCEREHEGYATCGKERRTLRFCRECVSGLPDWAIFNYVASRLEGSGHKLAEMLALQEPPGSNTDREFLHGHCCGNQFEKRPDQGDFYAKVARKAGQNTTGKIYLSALASHPGDPRAWVSSKAEVRKVLEERGWSSEGLVNYKPAVNRGEEVKEVGLAPDILEREVERVLAGHTVSARERADVTEKVYNKHCPHWVKK